MKPRAYFSIFGVAATAVLSGIVLWKIMIEQSGLGQLGLGGVFLASMLSHMTIVARDIFVPMFLSLTKLHHPILLGAVSGWGGAIGDASTYFLGWGVAETIRGSQESNDRLTGWIKKHGLWAVLLFSVTPLPDTPIILLAGTSRLPFRKLILAQGVGKTALYSLGAVIGGFILEGLTGSVGSLSASALIVVLSVIFCVLISWPKTRDIMFGWVDRLIP